MDKEAQTAILTAAIVRAMVLIVALEAARLFFAVMVPAAHAATHHPIAFRVGEVLDGIPGTLGATSVVLALAATWAWAERRAGSRTAVLAVHVIAVEIVLVALDVLVSAAAAHHVSGAEACRVDFAGSLLVLNAIAATVGLVSRGVARGRKRP